MIGAVIIKHKLCLSDRETVAQLQENPYLQYFVGLASYQMQALFAPSLFVEIRKRMGQSVFEVFQSAIIAAVEGAKSARGSSTTDAMSNDDDEPPPDGSGDDDEQPVPPSEDSTLSPESVRYSLLRAKKFQQKTTTPHCVDCCAARRHGTNRRAGTDHDISLCRVIRLRYTCPG